MVPSISKRIPKKVWEVGLPVKAAFSCKGIVMVFESFFCSLGGLGITDVRE